ncbi:MAG: hypothetical protein M0Q19_04185, partial [Candidatus Cloacimonetes bacterium]|nr:hypothetical protein [Candidatus Cloacimonadota bacterium]
MEQKIKNIIAKLQSPDITYADVRITFTDFEDITFINGNLRNYSSSKESPALGIRVLMDGCFGFAGSRDLSERSIENMIKRAKLNATQGAKFLKERVSFPALMPTIA